MGECLAYAHSIWGETRRLIDSDCAPTVMGPVWPATAGRRAGLLACLLLALMVQGEERYDQLEEQYNEAGDAIEPFHLRKEREVRRQGRGRLHNFLGPDTSGGHLSFQQTGQGSCRALGCQRTQGSREPLVRLKCGACQVQRLLHACRCLHRRGTSMGRVTMWSGSAGRSRTRGWTPLKAGLPS